MATTPTTPPAAAPQTAPPAPSLDSVEANGYLSPTKDGLRFCCVCNQGSHRSDWLKTDSGYVACDVHSTGEVHTAALARQALKA